MPKMLGAESFLNLWYPKNQIFITEYEFIDEERAINMLCRVPPARKSARYPSQKIPYVTAVNYVQSFSQACYLLTEHLLTRGLIPLDMTTEKFIQAASAYELYYRNLSMIFHTRVPRGELFPMRFVLKNWREIKKINDFVLFTFTNELIVIGGEMSFAYVCPLAK